MTVLAIIVASIAVIVAELRLRRRARRHRRLIRQLRDRLDAAETDLAHVSADLNEAYLASAAIVSGLGQERDRAELSAGRALNRSIAHRRTITALIKRVSELEREIDRMGAAS